MFEPDRFLGNILPQSSPAYFEVRDFSEKLNSELKSRDVPKLTKRFDHWSRMIQGKTQTSLLTRIFIHVYLVTICTARAFLANWRV